MSYYTIGEQIRALRKKKGWSQDRLGQQTGLSQSRISKLESGSRYPTSQEWTVLRQHLGIAPGAPFVPKRPLPYPESGWRVPPPDYHCIGDVPLSSRVYKACKSFGALADRSLLAIRKHSNRELVFRFLNEACLDSGHEAMFWLHALSAGGSPCWYAPSKAGFRQHRLVERGTQRKTVTDLRLPCLELKREGLALLLFPQVTVDTRRAYYRLDALACVTNGKKRCWVNIEIDGAGHDGEFDLERERALNLPAVRLNRDDLACEAMFEELLGRLRRCLETDLAP